MRVIATLSKDIDGRTSTWRFLDIDGDYCALGGNYKLVQYRTKYGMDKGLKWFLAKGYTKVA